MGTSISMRSPRRSRAWALARADIRDGAPHHAVLTDFMRAAAADEWLNMLTSTGVEIYAQTAATAWERVLDQRDGDPYTAVTAILSAARTEALTAGGAGVAVGLAERALARTLLLRLRDIATEPEDRQHDHGILPTDLVSGLLAELMRQSAMHFFARDAAAFTGTGAIPDAASFNSATQRIGDIAADAARAGRPMLRTDGPQGWTAAVRAAMQSAARSNGPGL